jgi:NAD(P)H-binding
LGIEDLAFAQADGLGCRHRGPLSRRTVEAGTGVYGDLRVRLGPPPVPCVAMRVFVAGATGVIGVRLLPLLVEAGHTVAGMTRSEGKAATLEALGAEPVVCDVFDVGALTGAVVSFAPDAVVHQLTDLPDRLADLPRHAAANDRIRSEGTRNLIAAAKAAGAGRFVAQSIAWRPPGRSEVVDLHERQVLDVGGVVARYGQLYGPGTYYETELPAHPRVHVDEAARATPALLDAPSGIVMIADPS